MVYMSTMSITMNSVKYCNEHILNVKWSETHYIVDEMLQCQQESYLSPNAMCTGGLEVALSSLCNVIYCQLHLY
jgi:hypothetical protein